MTILIFIVILTVLVLIHELGHFLVAKKLGIKVEEFGFGLPPRAFGRKIGETIYSINWLPIGGFVKLFGEDDPGVALIKRKGPQTSRSFAHRPLWQRASVVVAGVVMNFVLAVVVISFIFTQGVAVPTDRVHIEQVIEGTPAEQVGLKKGDVILAIDGKEVKNTTEVISTTRDKLGREVALTIEREKQKVDVKVTPRRDAPADEGPMGVAISSVEFKKYSIVEAPVFGTIESLRLSVLTAKGLGLAFWNWVILGTVPQDIAGPVGIAQITGRAVEFGPLSVLSFLGLLSLNLAILNILPIPALDGGRLLFMLIELVTRRRINPHFERYAHTIGLVILLGLMVLVTFRDISRLFSGQPILPTP